MLNEYIFESHWKRERPSPVIYVCAYESNLAAVLANENSVWIYSFYLSIIPIIIKKKTHTHTIWTNEDVLLESLKNGFKDGITNIILCYFFFKL